MGADPGGVKEYDIGPDQDLRTLAVEWNSQGLRFKEWRKAVEESTNEPLDESEGKGGNTALHMCRKFLAHGGDPKVWLINFVSRN